MEVDSFLTELYVMIDDWWQVQPEAHTPHLGRPPQISPSQVLTLAVLAHWPRWPSERDFWRFAAAHLRGPSHSCAVRAGSTTGCGPPNRSCGGCTSPWPDA